MPNRIADAKQGANAGAGNALAGERNLDVVLEPRYRTVRGSAKSEC